MGLKMNGVGVNLN